MENKAHQKKNNRIRHRSIIRLTMICIMLLFFLSGSINNNRMAFSSSNEKTEGIKRISFMTESFRGDIQLKDAFENLFYLDTGVQLEIIQCPENNWEAFMISRLTSSGAADVIKCPNNILPLVEEGKIICLDEYIKKDEEMMKIYEEVPEAFDRYTIDGKIYGIGNNRPFSMGLWVRQDWLDALGIDMPSSMDELTNMFYQLKECEGLQEGEERVYPLTLVGNLRSLNIFASAYGLRNEVFLRDDQFVDPFLEPEFEAYASYIKQLYDDEIITESFMTVESYSAVREDFGSENGASIVMWSDIYHTLSRLLDENNVEGYELVLLPAFETEDGVFGIAPSPPKEPFAITSDAEDPEFVFNTLIKWIFTDMDGILATSIGVEGYNFHVEEGKMVELNRIGFRGQGFPALYPNLEYPFELHDTVEKRLAFVQETEEMCKTYKDQVPSTLPSYDHKAYWTLYWELQDKRERLFFEYLEGELSYEEMISQYRDYYEEKNLGQIIEEMNQ